MPFFPHRPTDETPTEIHAQQGVCSLFSLMLYSMTLLSVLLYPLSDLPHFPIFPVFSCDLVNTSSIRALPPIAVKCPSRAWSNPHPSETTTALHCWILDISPPSHLSLSILAHINTRYLQLNHVSIISLPIQSSYLLRRTPSVVNLFYWFNNYL